MRSMRLRTVEGHRRAAAEGNSSRRLVEQHMRRIGAGRPSFGGRRTVLSCQGFLQHRLGLSVLWRPAHQRFSSDTRTGQTGLRSAAVPSLGRSLKRSPFSNSLSRTTTPEANTNTNASLFLHSAVGAGLLVAEAAQRIKIRATPVLSHARPNPSVERTSSSKLRLLPAAPHVER